MSVAAPQARGTRYEAVIGIEVHVQLRTASKMFCGCSTDFQSAPPNSHTCPVCLGLPGTLPVINRAAVEHVLATGLAIEAEVPAVTRWDRKNYFYPDLPKGYQISQYDLPLAARGRLTFETSAGPFTVGITRAHLEEDTARLVHVTEPGGRRVSLVDFNRSGVPLMEIVTEPELHTAEQARRYAEELRLLLLTIGASDAAMESGQMRVEANVSLRPVGESAFGTRVEVKNMNSFRSVERAVDFEIARQARALDAGEPLVQETRGWDDDRGQTYTMRVKEYADDYRYFPEPDLPPLRPEPTWLEAIRARLPELPAARRTRYRDQLGLSAYDAGVLVGDAAATALFEAALAADPELAPKSLANWVSGEYLRLAKQAEGGRVTVDPVQLARLVRLVADGALSGTNAKQVLEQHVASGEPVDAIVGALGLRQISDADALTAAVDAAIAANPAAVADIRAGKAQATGFLVGQVMKATRGQANASVVQRLLRERLELEDG
ncbi:MAG TPA: Asp-tRNA(Asn)/Glu-tRNA(Gln) amidotransferase subunit GatB [Candidatus Limnocylindrales bacterium]|nr:Asp-tRNA(Asn)/Glu-tRNA(Gln) amidotransferase subunit GatB [Candidatus Limnocylindrales bacterium]